MSDISELAEFMFGDRRAEEARGDSTTTRTITATAVSDSADGTVMVIMSDVVIPDEDAEGSAYGDVAVELPTTVDVRDGDEVIVSTFGSGPQTAPMVTGVTGGGDRTQGETKQAMAVAANAERHSTEAHHAAEAAAGWANDAMNVAKATAQHFWSDDNGAHVSTDANDAEGASNGLWNSEGLLIRHGDKPLTGVTQNGFLVYDGDGSGETHVMASMGRDGISLAPNSDNATISMVGGRALVYANAETYDGSVMSKYKSVIFGIGGNGALCLSPVTEESDGKGGTYLAPQGGVNVMRQGTMTTVHINGESITINGHTLYNRDLVTWTSFAKAISNGSATFSVRNGIATLACNFCCKNAMAAWSASQMLTTAQVAELWKYAPVDNNMKMTGFDDHKNIWTLSFSADGGVHLWATSGNVVAGTYLTTAFSWAVG